MTLNTRTPKWAVEQAKLTPFQEKFCLLTVELGNATAAYQKLCKPELASRREYCRMRATQMVNRYPLVKKRIEELQAEVRSRHSVTIDRVIQELATIALADIRDIADFDQKAVTVKSASEIPNDAARTIAEVKQTRDGVSVKTWSKLDALNMLGRHLGMFIDRRELTGKDGQPLIPDAALNEFEVVRYLAFCLEQQQRAPTLIEGETVPEEGELNG